MMKTSAAGVASIELDEGVVLKAYRCPAHVLTIGAGLTKASGVVDPKPGMTITKKEATRLLAKALDRNYEPRVRKAMPNANQHEFDGGVSFDFNTGAIGRASWVKWWRQSHWPETKRRFMMWNKAGGRVVRGLVLRREREFKTIRHGIYHAKPKAPTDKNLARIALPLGNQEILDIRDQLARLGYDPGKNTLGIAKAAVRQFQRDHDLTVDGIIGRATESTLQRMIDARRKSKTAAATTATPAAGTGAVASTDAVTATEALIIFGGIAALALVITLYLAWKYRDAAAVKLQGRFPNFAAKLRSI